MAIYRVCMCDGETALDSPASQHLCIFSREGIAKGHHGRAIVILYHHIVSSLYRSACGYMRVVREAGPSIGGGGGGLAHHSPPRTSPRVAREPRAPQSLGLRRREAGPITSKGGMSPVTS
eukprot:6584527-Pyramimonas_sp.AAC.1